MAFENFFTTPGNVSDNHFFDEGPKIVYRHQRINGVIVHSSSIDTTDVDPYRQGVELTHIKHFDAGVVKIHAGEQGHILRKNRLGMDKNFRTEPVFTEVDYFDAVGFIRAQEAGNVLLGGIITFPIVTGDNDQLENYVYDGVIEPFPIREVISFFSIEAPFQARGVKGCAMVGNSDSTAASDQVLTVDYFEPDKEQIAYLDRVDMIGISGSAIPLNGFFLPEKSTCKPFIDARHPRNVPTSSSYSNTLISALSLMSGSTDNYVPYNKKSAPAGSLYDNNPVGTDSISFGGMTY